MRTPKLIKNNGQQHTFKEWAQILNAPDCTLRMRWAKWHSLSPRGKGKKKLVEWNGKSQTFNEWSKELGVSHW